MLSGLRQLAAVVGLLVYAGAALLSGTDRQSRDFPSSPGLVGWPYDTGAARAHAIAAFVNRGPLSALGFARRAIESDPLSAQAVSVLGRSQLYSGQTADARRTFEVAGNLGWRDPMTQLYWLDQALQDSNFKVAAERLDALLRQSPRDENRDRFLALVSTTPEGRAELAERLKASPAWAEPYVTDLGDVTPEQLMQRTDIMARVGRGVWDCPTTAPMAQKLIDANLLNDARSLWRRYCTTSTSLVYDGGFDQLDTTKTTQGFEWQLSGRGDIDVQPTVDKSGNRRLDFEVSAARSLPALSQLIVLEPGRYRLTWRTPETNPNTARALSVSLGCTQNLADAMPGTLAAGARDVYVQDFEVDGDCLARRLVFWLAPRAAVHLDDVALQRL